MTQELPIHYSSLDNVTKFTPIFYKTLLIGLSIYN